MSNQLEKISTIVDIVNKAVVAFAIAVAGIWALYKYIIQESPSAQLTLDQIKRICSERGSLDIKIDARSTNRLLLGTVSLKNIGTRAVDLQIPSGMEPISVAELEFASGDKPRASRLIAVDFPIVLETHLIQWNAISVLPGRTIDLHFVAQVGHPGVYLISFRGGPRNVLPDETVCASATTKDEPASWAAVAIHQVKDDVQQSSRPAGRK